MNMVSSISELNKPHQDFKLLKIMLSSLSWLFAAALALLFVAALLLLQETVFDTQPDATIRKVDVALPPPPPPPPPLKMQQQDLSPQAPSINVAGLGGGPSLNFSSVPSLGLDELKKVERPEFDLSSLSINQSMAVDFPIIDVKNLDKRPRLVSSKYIQFPRSLIQRGIKIVPTKVQIIIDDKGNVYINKITDPIYPEMIDVIRAWVKNARFTIPTKNGLPVQAVYDYTLQFEYKN